MIVVVAHYILFSCLFIWTHKPPSDWNWLDNGQMDMLQDQRISLNYQSYNAQYIHFILTIISKVVLSTCLWNCRVPLLLPDKFYLPPVSSSRQRVGGRRQVFLIISGRLYAVISPYSGVQILKPSFTLKFFWILLCPHTPVSLHCVYFCWWC